METVVWWDGVRRPMLHSQVRQFTQHAPMTGVNARLYTLAFTYVLNNRLRAAGGQNDAIVHVYIKMSN